MANKVRDLVKWHSDATGTAKALLLEIADHASGDDGSGAFPGQPRLAVATGTSVRTVRRDLRALEKLGELEVRPRRSKDGLHQGTNEYRVRVEALERKPGYEQRKAKLKAAEEANRKRHPARQTDVPAAGQIDRQQADKLTGSRRTDLHAAGGQIDRGTLREEQPSEDVNPPKVTGGLKTTRPEPAGSGALAVHSFASMEKYLEPVRAHDPDAAWVDGEGIRLDSGQYLSGHHLRTVQQVRAWLRKHGGSPDSWRPKTSQEGDGA
jgi:hypothetical protein